jgi:hypothetical protein
MHKSCRKSVFRVVGRLLLVVLLLLVLVVVLLLQDQQLERELFNRQPLRPDRSTLRPEACCCICFNLAIKQQWLHQAGIVAPFGERTARRSDTYHL